jgi:hypothetical protein
LVEHIVVRSFCGKWSKALIQEKQKSGTGPVKGPPVLCFLIRKKEVIVSYGLRILAWLRFNKAFMKESGKKCKDFKPFGKSDLPQSSGPICRRPFDTIMFFQYVAFFFLI